MWWWPPKLFTHKNHHFKCSFQKKTIRSTKQGLPLDFPFPCSRASWLGSESEGRNNSWDRWFSFLGEPSNGLWCFFCLVSFLRHSKKGRPQKQTRPNSCMQHNSWLPKGGYVCKGIRVSHKSCMRQNRVPSNSLLKHHPEGKPTWPPKTRSLTCLIRVLIGFIQTHLLVG